jgi:hypothetical protein
MKDEIIITGIIVFGIVIILTTWLTRGIDTPDDCRKVCAPNSVQSYDSVNNNKLSSSTGIICVCSGESKP